MREFEPLIGEWNVDGEIPIDPPMKVAGEGLAALDNPQPRGATV